MDISTVKALSQVLDDHLNERVKRTEVIKKINGILHNKKTTTVIRELHAYVSSINGNAKNNATLIVIMVILRRNLDNISEVKEAVVRYGLTGCLYGGLYTLLAGNSKSLSIKVNLNDSKFENKYAFITRFVDFNYWNYIEMFQAAKVLHLAAPHKFEKLTLSDKTRLLLLNMASYHLEVEPSKELVLTLLQSDDELYQNLGFNFITRSISGCIADIDYIKRSEEHGINHGKKKRVIRKKLIEGLKECYLLIEQCNKRTQTSLLMNYLLVHQHTYPEAFARSLVSNELQEEFIYQISQTGKVKTLKDVSFLVELISHTPAINEDKRRISKKALYMAIVNVLLSFINNRIGIYGWDTQQCNYTSLICQRLPASCIRKLRVFLIKRDANLISNELDELVRFNIYLEDKRQHDIISGILDVIDSITLNSK